MEEGLFTLPKCEKFVEGFRFLYIKGISQDQKSRALLTYHSTDNTSTAVSINILKLYLNEVFFY